MAFDPQFTVGILSVNQSWLIDQPNFYCWSIGRVYIVIYIKNYRCVLLIGQISVYLINWSDDLCQVC